MFCKKILQIIRKNLVLLVEQKKANLGQNYYETTLVDKKNRAMRLLCTMKNNGIPTKAI